MILWICDWLKAEEVGIGDINRVMESDFMK